MAGVVIEDRDRGYAELIKNVRQLGRRQLIVKVGVPDTPHEPSGTPCDEIGAAHEFGQGTVPERSFLRAWLDERTEEISRVVQRIGEACVQGDVGRITAQESIGAWAAENVKQRMRAGLQPELQNATVNRKVKAGNARPGYPLIASEQLIESITYEGE